MKRDKYMGMDVHQAPTVVAVINAEGKIVLETIAATAAGPIRRLIESINGPVHVTLEETTQAEWLHDRFRDSLRKSSYAIHDETNFWWKDRRATKPMPESWPSCCDQIRTHSHSMKKPGFNAGQST
jgi:hypothetical protein